MTNEEFRRLRPGDTVTYLKQRYVVIVTELMGNFFRVQISTNNGTWVSNPRVLEKA